MQREIVEGHLLLTCALENSPFLGTTIPQEGKLDLLICSLATVEYTFYGQKDVGPLTVLSEIFVLQISVIL